MDRDEARARLAAHDVAALSPPPGDLLAICWWAMQPARWSTEAYVAPHILFGDVLWRRMLILPRCSRDLASRLRFEGKIRSLPPPERLWRWFRAVEAWHREHADPIRRAQPAQQRHAVAAE